uniref:Uncharacterized protein n=1 Tax=Opuntia streptacantha TaxID=393608 RepID=A0A7C9DEN4_OPUST
MYHTSSCPPNGFTVTTPERKNSREEIKWWGSRSGFWIMWIAYWNKIVVFRSIIQDQPLDRDFNVKSNWKNMQTEIRFKRSWQLRSCIKRRHVFLQSTWQSQQHRLSDSSNFIAEYHQAWMNLFVSSIDVI